MFPWIYFQSCCSMYHWYIFNCYLEYWSLFDWYIYSTHIVHWDPSTSYIIGSLPPLLVIIFSDQYFFVFSWCGVSFYTNSFPLRRFISCYLSTWLICSDLSGSGSWYNKHDGILYHFLQSFYWPPMACLFQSGIPWNFSISRHGLASDLRSNNYQWPMSSFWRVRGSMSNSI